jgi:Spy/CpxP family protein refolding chaperone
MQIQLTEKEFIMNSNRKWIIAAGTSISLALAALSVSAQSGPVGRGMGQGMHDGQHQGMHGGQHHGKRGDRGAGGTHRGAHDRQAIRQLMTPEERTAMREKMHAAKTPEERQQIAAANRAEMQKRAKEKGITLPEPRGPRGHGGHGGRGGSGTVTSSIPQGSATLD